MRKVLLVLAAACGVVLVAGYLYRDQLKMAAVDRATANMFVDTDTDAYDPGIAIGQPVPAIHALLNGREVSSVDGLMGKRGLLLFVNRSVDW
jgi:hypothetical protein